MNVPEHYRKFFRIYLRFAIVMMIVALLLGITFQESAKKTPVSAALPAGIHLESIINLALLHGHAFLIGVLIPLAVTWMLYLGLALNYRNVPERTLCWATRLYLPAAVIAIGLMMYKGYVFQLGVRHGEMDFAALNASMFGGNHALRGIVYGLTHTSMAVGLGWFGVSFWKSMGGKTGQ